MREYIFPASMIFVGLATLAIAAPNIVAIRIVVAVLVAGVFAVPITLFVIASKKGG